MSYRIRYTRTTNHIEGIPERTLGPATDTATTGVVGYYATSACPSLTRSGHTMGTADGDYTDLLALLEDARARGGRKLCKHCERAVTKVITDTYEDAQWHAIEAAKRLDIATNTTNEQLIADAEDFAERMNDRYDDAAFVAGRCRIFKCEAPRHESSAWCEAHTVTDTADDYAARINAAYDKAEAANTHLSPTGQRLAAASAAHDEAMRIAHEGEGTSAQADADAAYEAARDAYRAASANHRAAREATRAAANTEREAIAALDAESKMEHDPADCPRDCGQCEREAIAALDALNALATEAAERHAAPAPDTYAAALAALPVGTDVALYLTGDDTVNGSIAGTGTDGAMVKLDNGRRRQVAYTVVESFEFYNHDTDEWVDPIADAEAAAYARETIAHEDSQLAPTAPVAPCGERLMHNGIPHYCRRPVGHHGTGGTAHNDGEGMEWMPGQTMPLYCPVKRSPGGCRQCEEDAAAFVAAVRAPADAPRYDCPERTTIDGIGYACVQHGDHAEHVTALGASWWTPAAEPVVATLDHIEPGRAAVTVTGGHGRQREPRAWLAHAGGAWVLADDYDGASYSVTGPDAERAVRAWAVLIGVDLDDLAVTVQYPDGPMSPPVPEAPVAQSVTLEWVRDREEVNVFRARGNAHDYHITEHYDGASLMAYLRGKGGPVEVYRRRYTTRPGARRAAQSFEHRHGPMYAPAA